MSIGTDKVNDAEKVETDIFSFFREKTVLFLLSIICIILFTRVSNYPVATSYILEVPYHDQQTSYYCGPAAVQMVLEYSNGLQLTQDQLSLELQTDDIEGVTYTYAMDDIYQINRVSKVSSGRTSLNQLKQKINQGYAPILLIWFDNRHETGHYVVAVGYNETGVFINDPWPQNWEQPEGRKTGSYVYLSNDELHDLWSSYYQWSMTVPFSQPEEKAFKVDVEINGIPENAKTRLYLNGKPIETLRGDDHTTIQLIDEPDYHFLRVEVLIEDDNGVEYICQEPVVFVTDSSLVRFDYQAFRSFNP